MNWRWTRILICCALTCVALMNRASAGDIGSVWIESVTENSITVNWSVTDSKFPEVSPTSYEVCWKKAGKLDTVCGQNSVTVSSKPHTITGLDCNETYKIRIKAKTKRKKNNGSLVNEEYRQVNETKTNTAACGAGNGIPSGSVYATTSTSDSITVTVEWSDPSEFTFMRLAYKKRARWFEDIWNAVTTRDDENFEGWVDSPNSKRGMVKVDPVQFPYTTTFSGLKACTGYKVAACGFKANGDAKKIGKTYVDTTGTCKTGGLFLEDETLGNDDGLTEVYLGEVMSLYAPSFVPAVHVIGVVPFATRAIAIDHAPGSGTAAMRALDTAAGAPMLELASVSATLPAPTQDVHAAELGSGNHLLVADGMWDVYSFANPTAPVRLGGVAGPAVGHDVATRGNVGYVAMGSPGLAVVDASSASSPSIVNTVIDFGTIVDSSVVGNRLFVAAYDVGVLSFDVTDPLSPVLVGAYLPGYLDNASALAADATHVYVANDGGLEVLDANTLTLITALTGLSDVWRMELAQSVCFVGGSHFDGGQTYDGLLRFDVSVPTAPLFMDSQEVCSDPGCEVRTFAVRGDRLFAALYGGGVVMLDARPVGNFEEMDRWSPGSSPVLAHIAATDATFAAVQAAEEAEGETSINNQDTLDWLIDLRRSNFEAWQADGSLQGFGADLVTWVSTHLPADYASFQAALDPVGADGFNIDVGTDGSVPMSTAFGPGSRSGTWTLVAPTGSTVLRDTSGRSSSAIASCAQGSAFSFDDPETDEDDEALYDDGQRIGGAGAIVDWTFSNLLDGDYLVTTSACNPDGSTAVVRIEVIGSLDGPKTCGGPWPDVDVEGITFVRHRITAAGGSIQVRATTLSGIGVLNGFQLERLGRGKIARQDQVDGSVTREY